VADGNEYLVRGSNARVSQQAPGVISTSEPSDLDLARSAAAGKTAAFHELVDRHAKRLFRTAMSLTVSRCDAEDLLQETLIGAFRGLKKFDGRSSVKTWLVSILMRQAAKSWHRSRFSRRTISIRTGESTDQSRERDDIALVIGSSNDASDQRMDFNAVLDELPQHYREVIVLREIQEMSYDEIARALSIPRGTVESRVHRARLQLREHLRAYVPELPRREKGAQHAAV